MGGGDGQRRCHVASGICTQTPMMAERSTLWQPNMEAGLGKKVVATPVAEQAKQRRAISSATGGWRGSTECCTCVCVRCLRLALAFSLIVLCCFCAFDPTPRVVCSWKCRGSLVKRGRERREGGGGRGGRGRGRERERNERGATFAANGKTKPSRRTSAHGRMLKRLFFFLAELLLTKFVLDEFARVPAMRWLCQRLR